MLKKKKDAELSITVIIVAILGLIVLVVMIFIFGEGTSDAVTTIKTCAAKGGVCKDTCNGRIIDGVELGCTGKMVCCIDI